MNANGLHCHLTGDKIMKTKLVRWRITRRSSSCFSGLVALGMCTLAVTSGFCAAEIRGKVTESVARELASLQQFYRELHASPELSFHEEKTAGRVAAELKKL